MRNDSYNGRKNFRLYVGDTTLFLMKKSLLSAPALYISYFLKRDFLRYTVLSLFEK